jgi:molybdate transport system substrate-binding protein
MSSLAAAAVLVISASSAFQPVLEALRPSLEKAAGGAVEIRYGATGVLARGIGQAGGADLFVASDEATARRLASDGLLDSASLARCGRSTLAAVSAKDAGFALPRRVDGATAVAFARLPFRRLAIPSSKTSPHGGAVEEVLQATRIYAAVKERLLPAESSGQALELVVSGRAEAGLVPLSLAKASGLPFSEVDVTLFEPLFGAAGVVSASPRKDAALRVLDVLVAPASRDAWRDTGFTFP